MTISALMAWQSWEHQKNHSLKATLYTLQHTSCQKESALILLEELPSHIPTLEVQLAPR